MTHFVERGTGALWSSSFVAWSRFFTRVTRTRPCFFSLEHFENVPWIASCPLFDMHKMLVTHEGLASLYHCQCVCRRGPQSPWGETRRQYAGVGDGILMITNESAALSSNLDR